MGLTFLILAAVEPHRQDETRRALFRVCVLGVGLTLRAYSSQAFGIKNHHHDREVAAMVSRTFGIMQPRLEKGKNHVRRAGSIPF